jgi:DNA-binding transcriptional LysR family regulator
VIEKLLRESGLVFHTLFIAKPHIFVGDGNPLAKRDCVTLADLEEYPCLSFEQGNYNSFYFSEEIQSATYHKKNIRVSDRATIFSLMLGLDGYTISTGIVSADLSGKNIVAVPLLVDEPITVGWIAPSASGISQMGRLFLGELADVVKGYDVDIINTLDAT